jgi:hypothetical protein
MNCSKGVLFDHLVGTCEQRLWNDQPKRLSGLEINHHFVLGRRLHRKVGRLRTLEDAINVTGRAPVWVDRIGPVGDEAAGSDEEALPIHCRQFVAGRQRDDQIAMKRRKRAPGHD